MSSTTKALAGGLAWVGFTLLTVPNLLHSGWAHALLLLAALVIVPFAVELAAEGGSSDRSSSLLRLASGAQLPAAILLAAACALPPGGVAALLATPWVLVCGAMAVAGCLRATHDGSSRALDALSADAALIFIGVGGAWVFADRAGFQPLSFSPAIVQLTAVHFHFAGLLLPLFAGLLIRRLPLSMVARFAACGVILGVPAVAIGITTSQLGWGGLIEAVAGCALALAGSIVAWLHLRIALADALSMAARVLFGLAGGSLLFGMSLAAAYALRGFLMPVPWLDLPWMRALHGTANALGFGLCGALAWRTVQRPA